MNKEKMIEILMADRCTKVEAEKFSNNGTSIYDGKDFESNYIDYANEYYASDEDIKELAYQYKDMIDTQTPIPDWGIVNLSGEKFYIEYEN